MIDLDVCDGGPNDGLTQHKTQLSALFGLGVALLHITLVVVFIYQTEYSSRKPAHHISSSISLSAFLCISFLANIRLKQDNLSAISNFQLGNARGSERQLGGMGSTILDYHLAHVLTRYLNNEVAR